MTTNRRYAEGTAVSVSDSQQHIRTELLKRGATQIGFFDDYQRRITIIGFELGGSAFMVYLPIPPDSLVDRDGSGKKRLPETVRNMLEKEKARLHRALFLLIKAKLIAAEEKITTLEREFFADRVVMTVDGKRTTVYEWYTPQLEYMRKNGLEPPLLPAIEQPKLIAALLSAK